MLSLHVTDPPNIAKKIHVNLKATRTRNYRTLLVIIVQLYGTLPASHIAAHQRPATSDNNHSKAKVICCILLYTKLGPVPSGRRTQKAARDDHGWEQLTTAHQQAPAASQDAR